MDIDDLFEKPCHVIDVMPQVVSADLTQEFSQLESFLLAPEQVRILRRKFANIIMKLGCYFRLSASTDCGETFTGGLTPAQTQALFEQCVGAKCLYILAEQQGSLIVADGCDIYMSIYSESERFISLVRELAASEDLFFR